MMKYRQLFMLAMVIALIPAATSATASTAASTSCAGDVASATAQISSLTAIRDRQTTALGSATERLSNFINQAQAQGHSVTAIVTDHDQLTSRTSDLTASYAALTKAVTATGTLCGDPTSHTAALTALAATRGDVSALDIWYTTHLKVDLTALAGGK